MVLQQQGVKLNLHSKGEPQCGPVYPLTEGVNELLEELVSRKVEPFQTEGAVKHSLVALDCRERKVTVLVQM